MRRVFNLLTIGKRLNGFEVRFSYFVVDIRKLHPDEMKYLLDPDKVMLVYETKTAEFISVGISIILGLFLFLLSLVFSQNHINIWINFNLLFSVF